MTALMLGFLIGGVAGLRTMMAPAAVSLAAGRGWIDLSATPLAFMGYAWAPYIFGALAAVELVTDQLPSTPSRKVPMQFGARIATGAWSGACLGAAHGALGVGAVGGALGAIAGTLGGAEFRGSLANRFGNVPAALIEDAVAILGAFVIVAMLA